MGGSTPGGAEASGRLEFLSRRPGRRNGEERVVLGDGAGRAVAEGLVFWGNPRLGLRPWADIVVYDDAVLELLARELGAGSSLMVAYDKGPTFDALRRKVPPAATPIGLALLRAGCRWLKDWYYPEGGLEGGMKLQGVVPLSESHRRRSASALLRELEEWEVAVRTGRPPGTNVRPEWLQWSSEAKRLLEEDLEAG